MLVEFFIAGANICHHLRPAVGDPALIIGWHYYANKIYCLISKSDLLAIHLVFGQIQ